LLAIVDYVGCKKYNCKMSTSVSPAGNPVLVDCLAARLYAFSALLLSFGCPGRPDAAAASPITITSRTRLKLGIVVLCGEIPFEAVRRS
jgi:hypothetical protein